MEMTYENNKQILADFYKLRKAKPKDDKNVLLERFVTNTYLKNTLNRIVLLLKLVRVFVRIHRKSPYTQKILLRLICSKKTWMC